MNVAVLTFSGCTVVRPDTTRIKEGEDTYLPDDVICVSWSPVLFARVSRPGRCISARFAPRYWDIAGVGVLLYPENYISSGPEGFACASCLDHTTLLSAPYADRGALGGMDFGLRIDSATVFSTELSAGLMDAAIAQVSGHCFLRNGDYVCVELAPRETVLSSPGTVMLEGYAGGVKTFETKLNI